MRGVARDWQVAVVQFLKSGAWQVGEEKVCRERLGVDWFAVGEGFTWESDDLTEDEAVAQAGWAHAKALIEQGEHRLVVLDEITYPMTWGWIDTAERSEEHTSELQSLMRNSDAGFSLKNKKINKTNKK